MVHLVPRSSPWTPSSALPSAAIPELGVVCDPYRNAFVGLASRAARTAAVPVRGAAAGDHRARPRFAGQPERPGRPTRGTPTWSCTAHRRRARGAPEAEPADVRIIVFSTVLRRRAPGVRAVARAVPRKKRLPKACAAVASAIGAACGVHYVPLVAGRAVWPDLVVGRRGASKWTSAPRSRRSCARRRAGGRLRSRRRRDLRQDREAGGRDSARGGRSGRPQSHQRRLSHRRKAFSDCVIDERAHGKDEWVLCVAEQRSDASRSRAPGRYGVGTIAFPMINESPSTPTQRLRCAFATLGGRHVHHERAGAGAQPQATSTTTPCADPLDGKVVVIPGVAPRSAFSQQQLGIAYPAARHRAIQLPRCPVWSPEIPEGARRQRRGLRRALPDSSHLLRFSRAPHGAHARRRPGRLRHRFRGAAPRRAPPPPRSWASPRSPPAAASAAARLTMGSLFACLTAAARSAALGVPSAPFASRAASAGSLLRNKSCCLGLLQRAHRRAAGRREGPAPPRSRFLPPSDPFGRRLVQGETAALALGRVRVQERFASADARTLRGGRVRRRRAGKRESFGRPRDAAFAGHLFRRAFPSFAGRRR